MIRRVNVIIAALLVVMSGIWILAEPCGGIGSSLTLSAPVRLRKLHLVRPDLIPYPLDVPVYC